MAETARYLKDLSVGDLVATSVGTAKIIGVQPIPFIEIADGESAIEVTWEVNGEYGSYIGDSNAKIKLAEKS